MPVISLATGSSIFVIEGKYTKKNWVPAHIWNKFESLARLASYYIFKHSSSIKVSFKNNESDKVNKNDRLVFNCHENVQFIYWMLSLE